MYCSNCGKEIADNLRFCNHCGTPIVPVQTKSVPEQEMPKPSAPTIEQPAPLPAEPSVSTTATKKTRKAPIVITVIVVVLVIFFIIGHVSNMKFRNQANQTSPSIPAQTEEMEEDYSELHAQVQEIMMREDLTDQEKYVEKCKVYLVDGVTCEEFPWSNSEIEVTFVGYYDNPEYFEKGVMFEVTNKGNREIEFATDYKVVNGATNVGLYCIRLSPGETGTLAQDIYEPDSEMENLDIINDIQIAFRVSYIKDEEYTGYSCSTDEFSIHVADGESVVYDEGLEVLNQDGIRVVYQGNDQDHQGTFIKFYVENNTEKPIIFYNGPVKVDGETVDLCSGETIYPGGHANTTNYVTDKDDLTKYIKLKKGSEVTMSVYFDDEDYNILLSSEEFSFFIE